MTTWKVLLLEKKGLLMKYWNDFHGKQIPGNIQLHFIILSLEKGVYSSRDLVWSGLNSQMLTEMLEKNIKHRDNFGSESL